VRFTGHSRNVVPQYGICFVLPFWQQELDDGFWILGKFVESWINLSLLIDKYNV
jgi:hypothetical protein